MKKKKQTRKKGGIVLFALLLLIAVLSFDIIKVYGQVNEAQQQEAAIRQQLMQTQEANASLRSDLDHADDEEFIKELARELLDLVEPGERIFYDVHS